MAARSKLLAALILGCASIAPALSYSFADKSEREAAVDAWLDDAGAAQGVYGHISTWETSAVTDMSYLFGWV